MKELILNTAKKVWKEIGHHKTPGDLDVELDVYKKMLNIFHIGDYCYFVFCPPKLCIENKNQSITNLLRYEQDEFNLEFFLKTIHPDDLQNYLNFEATITEFWQTLPVEKVMKYKTRYDFRIRCKNNKYKRVLQQVVPIQSDNGGAVLRIFVVFTDVSFLKQSNKMILSLIGLDGEPSYINVRSQKTIVPYKDILTKREKQIFNLLIQNMTSKEIADNLHISITTVGSHRKNIYKKTGVSSVLQLVQFGLEKGWI